MKRSRYNTKSLKKSSMAGKLPSWLFKDQTHTSVSYWKLVPEIAHLTKASDVFLSVFPALMLNALWMVTIRVSGSSYSRLISISPLMLKSVCKWRLMKMSLITISLFVIGLKNSYFPLIHLPSWYWTVQ